MMPLGDVRSANRLNYARYNRTDYTDAEATATVTSGFVGLDMETFAQSTDILESGLSTADLALPINVEMKFAATGVTRVTNVVLADAIFTLDSQGLVSVSM
jgi:hypothetical protein